MKIIALLLAAMMILTLVACGGGETPPADDGGKEATEGEATEGEATGKVYRVVNLVNGNLGDKSFFDSAEAGLKELEDAGRIELKTIEMGATDADQPKWEETLMEVSSSENTMSLSAVHIRCRNI